MLLPTGQHSRFRWWSFDEAFTSEKVHMYAKEYLKKMSKKSKEKRVLVIGESNSVMKGGWVKGFSDSLSGEFSIANRSIGSTGFLNVVHQLLEVGPDLDNFDFLLLDHLINDIAFYIRDQENYFDYLDKVYDFLLLVNIQILVVAYSRVTLSADERNFLSSIINYFNNKQILFYNVSDVIFEMKNSKGLEKVSDLYRDSFHPLPKVSYEVGCDIARVVQAVGRKKFNISKFLGLKKRGGIVGALPYKILDIDFFKTSSTVTDCNIKNVFNSLVNYSLAEFHEFEAYTWKIPVCFRGWNVIGFMFNSSSALGFCAFQSSANRIEKSISNVNYGKDSPVLWARPLHNFLSLGDSLSIDVSKISFSFEDTEFCDSKIISEDRSKIGIVSLILTRP